jgi:hypothetical protein
MDGLATKPTCRNRSTVPLRAPPVVRLALVAQLRDNFLRFLPAAWCTLFTE